MKLNIFSGFGHMKSTAVDGCIFMAEYSIWPILVWLFEKRMIGLMGMIWVLVWYSCMAIYYGYGMQP